MSIKKKVALVCGECNSRNYTKNKSAEKRLEINKYCQTCGKHTLHKEDK